MGTALVAAQAAVEEKMGLKEKADLVDGDAFFDARKALVVDEKVDIELKLEEEGAEGCGRPHVVM